MLEQFNKFVFTPGHGGGDPGAVAGTVLEANNVTKICKFIDEIQREYPISGCSTEILDRDNNLGLQSTINEVNRLYRRFDANSNDNIFVLEIHQDMNAPHLEDEKEKRQMGTYYFNGDPMSANIADSLTKKFIDYGAYNVNDGNMSNFNGTWRQDHYLDWAGYSLGFIQHTNPLAMIIECGFVSGNHTDEELKTFAWWIYSAIYELKTGEKIKKPQTEDEIQNIMYEQEKAKFYSIADELKAEGIYNEDFTEHTVKPRLGKEGPFKFISDFPLDELKKQFRANKEKEAKIKQLENEIKELESKEPVVDNTLVESLDSVLLENQELKKRITELQLERASMLEPKEIDNKINTSERNPFNDFIRWIQSYKSDLITSFLPFAISIGILPASASTGRLQDIIVPLLVALQGYLLHSNTLKNIKNIFKK